MPRLTPARTEWTLLALCWFAAVGFIVFCSANDQAILHAADQYEQLWRLSPENQAGRGACAEFARTAPPLTFDPDAYCWINYTQEQNDRGAWRLHHFTYDNAPYGREKHWSSSLNWWLWLLGGLTHLVTGQPVDEAIASASLWANPLLFALALAALGIAVRRAFGAWPTGILLVTLGSLWGVQWDFSYARPDHHGLHLIAFVGMIASALAGGLGWVTDNDNAAPTSLRRARCWMAASGLFGAMGLWIGATQQCVGIAALGAGATLSGLVFAGRPGPVRFTPQLWRWWARVGAAGSVGFYLLEYFPSEMGMRLEINHPLYALAWLGGGELMWLLGQWKIDRRLTPGQLARGTAGLLAMAAMPAALLFGPVSWCVFRDPWLAHVFRVIAEGKPWFEHWAPEVVARQAWLYTGVLLASLPLAAALLVARRRGTSPCRLAAILTVMPMALMYLGWTLLQTRWMGFLECSLAILAVVIAPGLWNRGTLPVALLALTVPGWAANLALLTATRAEDPMNHARTLLSEAAGIEELSWNLRLLACGAGRPLRIMAPAGPSPLLHYFGGVETVGSFYWENLAGSRATLDFYNDGGDATARHIARERRLDYVLVSARPEFVLELQTIQLGHMDVGAARKTLAYRLANPLGPPPPPWLEPTPLLDAPLAVNRGFKLYRVRADRLGD